LTRRATGVFEAVGVTGDAMVIASASESEAAAIVSESSDGTAIVIGSPNGSVPGVAAMVSASSCGPPKRVRSSDASAAVGSGVGVGEPATMVSASSSTMARPQRGQEAVSGGTELPQWTHVVDDCGVRQAPES
jgi:hypothetical protein